MKKSTITAISNSTAVFNVKPPSFLPRESHANFKAICTHLHSVGKYHETDQLLVAQYCLAEFEALTARKIFMEEGMQIMAAHGAKAHPMIAVANQCRTTMGKLAGTLGLGAANRHRISSQVTANEDTKEKSDWHKAAA